MHRAVRGDINDSASLLEKAADCPRGVSGFVGREPNLRFQVLLRSVGLTSGPSFSVLTNSLTTLEESLALAINFEEKTAAVGATASQLVHCALFSGSRLG